MKLSHSLTLLFFASIITLSGCADLTVENKNEPDSDRYYFNESEIRAMANDLFRQWYVAVHEFSGPQMALSVGADAATSSWGTSGMQLFGTEPRPGWNNSVDFAYAHVTKNFFENMYDINSTASDILELMSDDFTFANGSDDAQFQALLKMIQGLTTGYIALTFDKGYIVSEETTDDILTDPELVDYNTIMNYAITRLEESIEISNSNSFILDQNVIRTNSGYVDNIFLEQIAHSFIARFMVSVPRSVEETSNIDWTVVESHARSGIVSDFTINLDQQSDGHWYNLGYMYLVYPGVARVDMRVINMMNSNYPAWNSDGSNYPAPDSATIFSTPEFDNRLWTDYMWLSSNDFRPERGLYFFSSFRFSRYDETTFAESGDMPEISYSEIQTILAEALLHQNRLPEAVSILNSSARTTRGGLPVVSTDEPEIFEAIHHEVVVEQFGTGTGHEFFFMRRYELLQEGTPYQFPLPAAILKIIGEEEPYYTFGGIGGSSACIWTCPPSW